MSRPPSILAAIGLPADDDDDEAALPPAAVLSDLSANIFAALLIILILLLQLKVAAEARPEPARPIAADRVLPVRSHGTLGAARVIALLRARGPEGAGAGFDLVAAGLRRQGVDATIPGEAIAAAVAAAAEGRDPVRLYVFSNRWFAETTAALTASGRGWSDLSVPRALRDPDDPQAWSPAFLRLVATGGDLAAFRDGLARLLAATAAPLVPDGRVASGNGGRTGSAAPSGADTGPSSPFAALRHRLALILAGLALTLGVGLVALLEFRFRAPALPSFAPE